MDVKYHHEKILIVVALALCVGILFYNAFFIPQISIPSVIYVEKDEDSAESDTDTQFENLEDDKIIVNDNKNESEENNENSAETEPETSQKVNINTATAEELDEKLSRIGPVIAKRIVDYRNTNGPFSSIEEIKNVSGIGEKTFEQIKDTICV